ncbi:putative Terpene synthase 21 [Hibiscus syriacus]|uniref:Terpene synthase 21 n=1 Tax=Hibiscus syriacus TaxID=106335 RepID=A0A6A2YLV6_HIBSY|nr:putative Terpene synthase 21 [Hibiscus syriacus]
MLMASTADPIENVKFIDALLRLGVSYHFENDIENQLESIFNSLQSVLVAGNDLDLNSTSIVFRVFRQYGFKMSCDVFNKFKDIDGKLKEILIDDGKGILSLYEASHLRVHGECILEEALAFTTENLNSSANKFSPLLVKQITNALDQPLNKSPPRLAARTYISFYEEKRSAKSQGFGRTTSFPLSFLMHGEIRGDDTFDAYGTPQELQRFIDALKRWEIGALDELQDYTKVICNAVLAVFDEIYEEATKEGRSYCVPYAKEALLQLANDYHAETKWYHDGYVPTFEEYMSVAKKTSTFGVLMTIAFIGMGEMAGTEAFEWLRKEPKIMEAIDVIGRLMDDIVSHKFEQLREHAPSSVECFMKQHNLSEKLTLKAFEKLLEDAWKDINEECMTPTVVPRDLLLRHLNFARPSYMFYKHGDGYTDPKYVKDYIRTLFVDPIPI